MLNDEGCAMSIEGNKTVVRRFFEHAGNGAHDDLIAADFVYHGFAMLSEVRGREAFKQLAAAYFAAFPDLHETTEDELAAGDKVARRVSWRGTHRGELMGMPRRGRGGWRPG